MFIAPWLNLLIVKTRLWQEHQIQIANFDMASCELFGFVGPAFGLPANRNEQSGAESARYNGPLRGRASGYKTRASFPAV